jgi:pimeloyl-ACP methyl ester carboxylesterase
MRHFGFERFFVCAHDRGARVAHRMALDHPDAVERMMLLDIAPTLAMYEATDRAFATAYFHWFFLIQPEPLPEMLIGADPEAYVKGVMACTVPPRRAALLLRSAACTRCSACDVRGLSRVGDDRSRTRSGRPRARP